MAPKKKDEKKEEEIVGKEDVGVFTFAADGCRYDGQFQRKADAAGTVKRHGNGVLVDAGGTGVYDGQWVDDEMHGEGTLTFDSGATYHGTFANGQFDGKGRYTWPDGSNYEGRWRFNKMHGEGVYTDSSGNRWYGKFYDGTGHGLLKEVA